jgi:hypothetical protein
MILETNKLSANAETLAPWGQLRHGLVGGNFQVVKKLKHVNGVSKCIAVSTGSPLSLKQNQLNPLQNLVFINPEFHVNPPYMPHPQRKTSLHFVRQNVYIFMISSV